MTATPLERKETVALILDCLVEMPGAASIPKEALNTELHLLGHDSPLDSIGLVTLIVDVEQRLLTDFDLSVTLASEKAMSRRHSPFRTVGSFADYICELSMDPDA